MTKYMVCDKARQALKQNRFSDAMFDTQREAETFRAEHVAKQTDRSADDYDIIAVEE